MHNSKQHLNKLSKNTWNSNSHLTVSYLATSGIEIFVDSDQAKTARGKHILKLPQWLSVIIQVSFSSPYHHSFMFSEHGQKSHVFNKV